MKFLSTLCFSLFLLSNAAAEIPAGQGPYEAAINANIAQLTSAGGPASAEVRASAAEKLGIMRAYRAADSLLPLLQDANPEVRLQAAISLGCIGNAKSLPALRSAQQDKDWLVRRAAKIALENLTGEVEGDPAAGQASTATAPEEKPAAPSSNAISTSTTYRGPASVLFDGQIGPAYWQTKEVKPPQWIQFELTQETELDTLTIHQYSGKFVMTGYSIETSLDGKVFKQVAREEKTKTPVKLVVKFPKHRTKFVKITSFGSVTPLYPTTFFEIEAKNAPHFKPQTLARSKPATSNGYVTTQAAWESERNLRALGATGGNDAVEKIIATLGPVPKSSREQRIPARAGIRALGRLGGKKATDYLISLLDNEYWARFAAEALGDIQDPAAVGPLLDILPKFSRTPGNKVVTPRDDRMSFPSEDRMFQTPYHILLALSRYDWQKIAKESPENLAKLKKLAPVILANLPGDHDTFMLYEAEPGHLLIRHLLKVGGMLDAAAEAMLKQSEVQVVDKAPSRNYGALSKQDPATLWFDYTPRRASAFLPAVCANPKYNARLLALLDHPDGWVRLNAAKAIGIMGDREMAAPLAKVLRDSKPEAAFGYSPVFKYEEYNDPAPRWREGVIRALGQLGGSQHVGLLAEILEDRQNVMDTRHAAAAALVDFTKRNSKSRAAIEPLKKAALQHDFLSIRHVARDGLLACGIEVEPKPATRSVAARALNTKKIKPAPAFTTWDKVPAILFVQGSNTIPNNKGTVVQQDHWRQTYVVTDSGPAYRPGRNLAILSPPRPDGKVTQLTNFKDGYVAEPELSWDGTEVLFTRRTQDNPWWHLWRMKIDGTGLEQITSGPFHYVGPAYLPNGKIVCAASRLGVRDEYHGYPCTSLMTMNPDGTDQRFIASNIGRDNEPSVLTDGRIVFSRLEVFYSRNKTELMVHAAYPDGTKDVVLYGPERRNYWRALDHGPRGPDDGQESPLTHRVVRPTAPRATPDGRAIVCASQAGLMQFSNRQSEKLLTQDYKSIASTTSYPLPDGSILCAATPKGKNASEINLGLYRLHPSTGKLDLIYNDPKLADFEPLPIISRKKPPVRPEMVQEGKYSGNLLCVSVFETQEPGIKERGRYIRLIEGTPQIGRHSTQTNPEPVWKNHGGTFARVLGTIPLASDGSFNVEAPADRLMQFQVLDSDKRVIGNQLTWISTRPGEQKSCLGCHETPETTAIATIPEASRYPAYKMIPRGNEMTYRAKAWFKGHLPPEIEERQRTIRAVNTFGR